MNSKINKNAMIHRAIFMAKVWGILLAIALFFVVAMFAFQSCSSADDIINEIGEEEGPTSSFSLNTKAVPAEMINNAYLYRFDANDRFMGRQLNVVQRPGDKLYTNSVPVGTWNFVLLMCKTNLFDKIINPVSPYTNGGRTRDKAWETPVSGTYLTQTPDLFQVYMPGVQIQEGVDEQVGPVTPRRNVAKIRFIMEDRYTGFDPITSTNHPKAFIDLYDVPKALRWDGGLYPNHTNPDRGMMREYIQFDNSTPKRKAKVVEFIIPAHLHNTELVAVKPKFKISMPLGGNSFFGSKQITPVELTKIPKPNHIIEVNITFSGEPETMLDINMTVKPWDTVDDQEEIFN